MPESILKVVLQGDATKLNASLKTASSRLESFGKKVQGIGKSMSIYVTAPITLAGGAAIKFASDFEESLNKVDVAFKNSSGWVRDFAKTTLESFGIAEGTALDMAALFGDMSTSMGLSTNEAANLSTSLVGLAGDLSSFKNMNIEEVTTALNGVFTGETESLKRLGIVMTEVNLQQFALEQGIRKNIKEFTQAEKVQLRYNYVMSKTANAQGDFARTSGGAANQMRIFQETLKELGVSFGEVILPLFTKIVKSLNGVLKKFRELSPATKEFIIVVAGIAAAIGPALIAIGSMSTAISFLTASITALNLAAAGITILAAAFVYAANQIAPTLTTWEQLKTAISGIATPMSIAGRLAMAEAEKIAKAAMIAQTAMGGLNAPQGPKPQGEKTDYVSQSMGFLSGPKIEETTKSVKDLTPEVAKLKTEIKGISEIPIALPTAFTEIKDQTKDLRDFVQVNFGSIAESMGMAFATALVNGENVFGALSSVIMGAMGDLLIQMGKAAVLAAKVTATFANPLTGLAAGIGAIALGTAIKAMSSKVKSGGFTAFANGGIVSSPTLGLVGEYAGARSNPEVIAPLDKLKSLLGDTGGNNVQVGGEFKLRGDDLYVSLERTKKRRNRIG